jgi:hypothetical protein
MNDADGPIITTLFYSRAQLLQLGGQFVTQRNAADARLLRELRHGLARKRGRPPSTCRANGTRW